MNKRYYSASLLKEAFDKFISKYKNEDFLGEAEHPISIDKLSFNDNDCHKIDSLALNPIPRPISVEGLNIPFDTIENGMIKINSFKDINFIDERNNKLDVKEIWEDTENKRIKGIIVADPDDVGLLTDDNILTKRLKDVFGADLIGMDTGKSDGYNALTIVSPNVFKDRNGRIFVYDSLKELIEEFDTNDKNIFDNIIDIDYAGLYPKYIPYFVSYKYFKYMKRNKNRQRLYEKRKRLGRRM